MILINYKSLLIITIFTAEKNYIIVFSGLYVKFANQLDKVSFIKNNFSLGKKNCLINLFNKNNIKY